MESINRVNYYKSAYMLVNNLIEAYKDGYSKEAVSKFYKSLDGLTNKEFKDSIAAFRLNIMSALIGFNKERIDGADKNVDYSKILDEYDVRKFPNFLLARPFINNFDSKKIYDTKFNSFMSVTKDNGKKQGISLEEHVNKNDYIKKIRNAFEHSQFELDTSGILPITKIKNHGYFEAELLNANFEYFVQSYFSNLASMGLSDKNLFYLEKSDIKITDLNSFKEFLDNMYVLDLKTELRDTYNGENTLEKKLMDNYYMKKIDVDSYVKIISDIQREIGIKIIDFKLNKISDEDQEVLYGIIMKKYPNYLLLDDEKQMEILYKYLRYIYDNAGEISNMLLNYAIITSNDYKMKLDNLEPDMENNHVNEISLYILKAYLVLYRLQCKTFEEIDYSLLDININNLTIYEIDNAGSINYSYLDDKLEKEKKKDKNKDKKDKEIINEILCEIIRDSLSHSNTTTYLEKNKNTIKNKIRFIDDFNDKKRVIEMDLKSLIKFTNSRAFLPSNCKIKLK